LHIHAKNPQVQQAASGSGVYSSSSFAKTDGTIYGYDAMDAEKSNAVKNSSGVVQSNKGHAVYVSYTYHKETTVGPKVVLFYNYPQDGNISSGWD
jgi:hypothetical protein